MFDGCDIQGSKCAPYPHTDLRFQAYADMRAYNYISHLVKSEWMNYSAERWHAVMTTIHQNNMDGKFPGGTAAMESQMLWKHARQRASRSFTMTTATDTFNWTMMYIKEGIERFAITDINNPAGAAMAQSDTVVMFDEGVTYGASERFNHIPGGANILYMDGHVEFGRYPSTGGHQWPVNQFSGLKLPGFAN